FLFFQWLARRVLSSHLSTILNATSGQSWRGTAKIERRRRSGTERIPQDLAQPLSVVVEDPPELAQHEPTLDGGDDRLHHGRFEEARLLPPGDGRLAECGGGAELAGDGEDDEVGAVAVVVGGGDDGGGSLLAGGLVGEGERDQDEVSELKAGHSRRRRDCPRPWRRPPRRAWRRPG